MPTLFRLISTIAVAVGLFYGSMIVLATFVEPRTTEMSVRVPLDKLAPKQ